MINVQYRSFNADDTYRNKLLSTTTLFALSKQEIVDKQNQFYLHLVHTKDEDCDFPPMHWTPESVQIDFCKILSYQN